MAELELLVTELLQSNKKLERDRGIHELQKHLATVDPDSFEKFSSFLVNLSFEKGETWELSHGILSALKLLMSHPWSSEDFRGKALEFATEKLEDNEYRVRIAAGELLGELCRRSGAVIYATTKQAILSGIKDNLERHIDGDTRPGSEPGTPDGSQSDIEPSSSPRSTALLYQERLAAARARIFHDTAGWKHLETWMKCLQSVIEGCGSQFNAFVDQELLDLIFTALRHTNRFVRETGYQVCAELVACNSQAIGDQPSRDINSIYLFGAQLAEHFGQGLSDNWSQVRLASSVATRQFLLALEPDARVQFYPVLLPRMCLNRYYVAEGVRIFSQDTWRMIMEDRGRELVQQFIGPTVDYYIDQSEADNHAVREAACACIAELGAKVNADCVRPFVPRLLDALRICFEDDSWPVRDAACLASGNFIRCFPEECKSHLGVLMPLFYENLQDNIPSARCGAAIALCNVAKTYDGEVTQDMLKRIEENFVNVEKQPANTVKYAGLEKGPATYGVVKRARDNDSELHSNNVMYSCGSLAPKMGRGGAKDKGGCMHSTFKRPAEPWECAEGCLHLLAELTSISSLHQDLAKLLPALAAACNHRHYTQHLVLLETLCKRLPEICKQLGKVLFKQHLERFFESIFYSLSCENALASSAASQCLNQLSNILGPNILRGRVEVYDPSLMEALEANIMVAPM